MLSKKIMIIEKFSNYILPLIFISSGFINIILYYFGIHQNNEIRRALSIIILVGIFIVSIVRLISIFKEQPEHRKKCYLVLSIITLWIVIYLSAWAKFGSDVGIQKNLLIWCIYGVPAIILSMDIAVNKKEFIVLKQMERYSLLLLPAAIIYIFLVLSKTDLYFYEGNKLGLINYLTLAYTYMFIMFALIFNYVFDIKNSIRYIEKNNAIRLFILVIFWILIICTGARGPTISLIFFVDVCFFTR